ncbi:hypothetical protein [Actinokineospora cianjurensis]|uniref:VOC family protein n=1 Tax=Actinokineospora cianjurensis TaxID=585224 RepID=A0A421B6K1_9PSEU|nr:hypothetical protein [Actinokineospora cianjurensis]RLK59863.1 hypothetical protein CLV68_0350 [Actinokineospora cianjurensis]
MSTELVIPGLPCRDLDDVVPFYTALGFEVTYRQQRPNPFASIQRGGIYLHFFAVEGFDPADSMGSVVIVVADTEVLHAAFAAGLRAAFGKVPVSGIPRMTRPRRKQGMSAGFSVVDPGGNWLRISGRTGDGPAPESRLGKAVETAARQADSRGDVPAAVRVLENALARHADAPPAHRLPALVYLAELQVRVGESPADLLEQIDALELTPADREALAADLAVVAELR